MCVYDFMRIIFVWEISIGCDIFDFCSSLICRVLVICCVCYLLEACLPQLLLARDVA